MINQKVAHLKFEVPFSSLIGPLPTVIGFEGVNREQKKLPPVKNNFCLSVKETTLRLRQMGRIKGWKMRPWPLMAWKMETFLREEENCTESLRMQFMKYSFVSKMYVIVLGGNRADSTAKNCNLQLLDMIMVSLQQKAIICKLTRKIRWERQFSFFLAPPKYYVRIWWQQ